MSDTFKINYPKMEVSKGFTREDLYKELQELERLASLAKAQADFICQKVCEDYYDAEIGDTLIECQNNEIDAIETYTEIIYLLEQEDDEDYEDNDDDYYDEDED